MKKSLTKVFALVLVVVLAFAAVACGNDKNNPSETASVPPTTGEPTSTTIPPGKKVGISMPTKSLQRWNQDGSYMEQMFKDAGYEVDLQYGGENEVPVQVSQIENMIAGGCNVLVIAAIDSESLTEVLAEAKTKNITVIAYDRLILNTDAVTYYATFDNVKVGTFQGKYIEQALDLANAAGPFNIEFFTGDPGDTNIIPFYNGAMSVLQPYLDSGKLVCLSGQTERSTVATEGWKTENAQSRMENLITSNNYGPTKTKLDAVMCSNDSTAQGVTNALVNAGYTKGNFPVITGQDCDVVSCKNMVAGTQAMSVFKDTRTLAAKVVEMVNAALSGGEVPINDTTTYDNNTGFIPSFLCEPVSYTVNDLQKLIDSGYYTTADLDLSSVGDTVAPVSGKIGISMPTKSLQRWNQDGSYMEQMFKDAGYEVDLQYGGENEVPVQVSQIENMIAGGCNVLVIAAIDSDSLTEVLAEAKSKNITVIAYDRLINNTDAVTYYATFDNLKVGTFQGKYIEQALDLANAAGPFNIEFFTGDPGDTNIIPFYDGAMAVLKPYLDSGKLVCPSGQTERSTVATEGWKTENAQSRMENLITSNNYGPTNTKLDAVMCSNDSTAQGVTNALSNAGYTKENFPIITGQDCDIVSCKNMIAGTQAMSVFKDTRTLAAKVVEMVSAALSGGTVPINDTASYNNGTGIIPSFLCEPVSYTVADLQKLVDSGYYTAADIGL